MAVSEADERSRATERQRMENQSGADNQYKDKTVGKDRRFSCFFTRISSINAFVAVETRSFFVAVLALLSSLIYMFPLKFFYFYADNAIFILFFFGVKQ